MIAADVTIDACVAGLDVRVRLQLLPADAAKLGRRRAVARDEVVELLRGRIASRPEVAQEHAPAGSPERERSREAGRAASHDDDVVLHVRFPC